MERLSTKFALKYYMARLCNILHFRCNCLRENRFGLIVKVAGEGSRLGARLWAAIPTSSHRCCRALGVGNDGGGDVGVAAFLGLAVDGGGDVVVGIAGDDGAVGVGGG